MHICGFSIENLGAFLNVPFTAVNARTTVVVGPNNTGKSTLLRILAGTASRSVHRTSRTIPSHGGAPAGAPDNIIELEITGQELLELSQNYSQFSHFNVVAARGYDVQSIQEYVFGTPSHHIKVSFSGSGRQARLTSTPDKDTTAFTFRRNHVTSEWSVAPNVSGGSALPALIDDLYMRRVLRIDAHRPVPSRGELASTEELASDASNLVGILDRLQAAPQRLAQYQRTVQRILPDVRRVYAVSPDNRQKEIRVSFLGNEERDDLDFSLGDVGSGTGHVLALAYAIVMSKTDRIIIIDEPNSYLHPGAVRELFRLMREVRRHQYILATHSLGALDELERPYVLRIERSETGESTIEGVTPDSVEKQRLLLRSVGASMADLFGADYALWVEGPTEAEMLKSMIAECGIEAPGRTAILPIVNTGDLFKSGKTLAADIYSSLSRGALLSPDAVFLLDREGLGISEWEDLRRRLKGRLVACESVRMTENLLLVPAAVAATINHEFEKWEHPPETVSAEMVEAYWNELPVRAYCADAPRAQNLDRWIETVHGAKLLQATFQRFSASALEYRKIRHGLMLARTIWQGYPRLLQPLRAALESAFAIFLRKQP